MLDEKLKKAYLSTTYKLVEHADVALRVGQKNQALEKLYKDFQVFSGAFVTAWNPYSRALSKNENHGLNQELHAWINARGLICFRGIGVGDDNNWPGEESYLILGLSREEAEELGKLFKQNAVIWVGQSTVPELLVCLEC